MFKTTLTFILHEFKNTTPCIRHSTNITSLKLFLKVINSSILHKVCPEYLTGNNAAFSPNDKVNKYFSFYPTFLFLGLTSVLINDTSSVKTRFPLYTNKQSLDGEGEWKKTTL